MTSFHKRLPKILRTQGRNKTLGVSYKRQCRKTTNNVCCNFHSFLGKWWAIFIHPSWHMLTKLILLNIYPRIVFSTSILFLRKGMAHILNLSTKLVMGLSTFNGLFIIWNFSINFMSNKFNPLYIMLHVVFKMH